MIDKKKKYCDFYLCELPVSDISGYMVKQVNSEGKVILETVAPLDSLDWFHDKDYKIVSRDEWERI